jgi:hypothetical protein
MAKRARPIEPATSMMTRRQFVRRTENAALGLIILSQGGLLSGCGSTSTSGTSSSTWDELAQRLQGSLVRPGDASYGGLYLPFNRRYEDVRPQGIAFCLDPADVRESVL